MSRTLLRAGVLLGTTALLALAGAAPAFAHITTTPDTVAKGSYGVVAFRVSNEDDTAGTIAVTINLPPDQPFSTVRTTPIAGWTTTTNEVTLNPPLKDDDGNAITKTIGSVTFKANPGTRLGPGQYLDFPLSLGPFPDNVDVVRMPLTQTYDNGKVVNWADPPNADGSEPELPTPSVTLGAATAGSHGEGATATPADPPSSDDTARWLGGAGLLVGALGLGLGGGAVLRTRRLRKSD